MKNVLNILIFFFTINCFSQTDNRENKEYNLAEKTFDEHYKEQKYYKYPRSKIRMTDSIVNIDFVKSIKFNSLEEKYKLILKNGLLDPVEINGLNNIRICCIEEMKSLNPDNQTKRFVFWLIPKPTENPLTNRINPIQYYFELKNDNAGNNTSFEEFVNGSRLTFLIAGTIVI